MLKKILTSKTLRWILSFALVFFAFRKIKIGRLLGEMTMAPPWFLVAIICYYGFSNFLGGTRWAILLLEKPKFKDLLTFTKATYLGSFYNIIFPTTVAGDLVKWLPITEKYKDLSKSTVASTVLIDRLIGLSAFSVVGFVALVLGKIYQYQFPDILLWTFTGLVLGVTIFYILVLSLDFEKFLGKYEFFNKIIKVVDLLKKENKRRILLAFIISLIAEPVWMITTYFYSQIFHVGFTLQQVFIFIPIIALILVLPISIAGFGARENLYLLFFSQLGFADEKILLVSTFSGIIGICNSLIGGIFLLLPDSKFEKIKETKIE